MARQLTEKQVLKKLDIPDFRHMTKAKVMQFASMLPYMNPEVAKKALEQFPEFAQRATEITAQYKEIIEKGFESNDSSVQAFYETCNAIVESLQKELDKADLTVEEKKYIIDKMTEVARMMGEKDTENKKFLRNMAILFGTTVVAVVVAAASVLGSNSQSAQQDDEDGNIE
jgi:hypothetical protein